MSFDTVSYIMGNKTGYSKGYDAGYDAGTESGVIVLQGSLQASDDGNGLITLTEVTNG